MKTTTALIAAGLLSASLPAFAQGVQPNQAKPGPATLPPQINSQQMYQGTGPQLGTMSQTAIPQRPGTVPGAQPQVGSVGVPPLPANLQNPMVASEVSTDIFAVMQLIQQSAQEQRKLARESRDVAREAQVSALESAADKMKQAAAAALQQAQVNGAMAMASGALSMGAGAIAVLPGAAAQVKPNAPGGQFTKELTAQEKQQAIGSIVGAQQVFSASMAAAEADRKKAQAAGIAVQSQQQAQAMQQMQTMLADAQQKLQAIMQAQNSTSQMLARP
jgi:hypothetical protein